MVEIIPTEFRLSEVGNTGMVSLIFSRAFQLNPVLSHKFKRVSERVGLVKHDLEYEKLVEAFNLKLISTQNSGNSTSRLEDVTIISITDMQIDF